MNNVHIMLKTYKTYQGRKQFIRGIQIVNNVIRILDNILHVLEM